MIDKTNYEIWFLDYLEGDLSDEQEKVLISFVEDYPLLKQELEEMSLVFLSDESILFDQKDNLKKDLSGSFDLEDMMIAKKEGDLSPKESIALDQYVQKDKHLKVSLNYFDKARLTNEQILFENKEGLRNTQYSLDEMDTLLLSYLDGTISELDKKWLTSNLRKDVLEGQLDHFRKTKMVADESILFSLKDKLYQKEKKVIPLFWVSRIVGIAASFLVLIFAYQLWDQNSNMDQQQLVGNQKVIIENQKIANHVDPLIKTNGKSVVEIDQVAMKANEILDKSLKETKIKNDLKNSRIKKNRFINNNKQLVHISRNAPSKSVIKNSKIDLNKSEGISESQIFDDKTEYTSGKVDVIQNLDSKNFGDLKSENTTDVYLRMSRSKSYTKQIDKNSLVHIEKDDEETGRRLNLGLFEVEVPEALIASVEAVQVSKKVYIKAKEEGRNVFSFALGGVSFYRSKKKN